MAEQRAGSWTISAGSVTAPAPAGPAHQSSSDVPTGRVGAAGLCHPFADKDKLTSSSRCPAEPSRLAEFWVGAACLTGSAGRVESEFHRRPPGMNYDLLFVSVL